MPLVGLVDCDCEGSPVVISQLEIEVNSFMWHPPPFMGPTPALACQVPPIHEVLGPTHLDIPLLTGFLSPPQVCFPKDLKLLVTGSNPCGGERNPVSRGISK